MSTLNLVTNLGFIFYYKYYFFIYILFLILLGQSL